MKHCIAAYTCTSPAAERHVTQRLGHVALAGSARAVHVSSGVLQVSVLRASSRESLVATNPPVPVSVRAPRQESSLLETSSAGSSSRSRDRAAAVRQSRAAPVSRPPDCAPAPISSNGLRRFGVRRRRRHDSSDGSGSSMAVASKRSKISHQLERARHNSHAVVQFRSRSSRHSSESGFPQSLRQHGSSVLREQDGWANPVSGGLAIHSPPGARPVRRSRIISRSPILQSFSRFSNRRSFKLRRRIDLSRLLPFSF